MPHRANVGTTKSGKTFLAQQSAKSYRRAGICVLVLHKPREPWPLDCVSWQTDDPERFLRMFWASQCCACFMELADADVRKYDERFHKCFSQGRHEGHRCTYISQSSRQVHPTIRDNCESLALFSVGIKAAKLWAEDFNDEALLGAVKLKPKQFLFKENRYTPVRLMEVVV